MLKFLKGRQEQKYREWLAVPRALSHITLEARLDCKEPYIWGKCSRCGGRVEKDENVCPHCGGAVDWSCLKRKSKTERNGKMQAIVISEKTLENIERAAEHYGAEAQMRQCMEECGELIVALNKYLRATSGGQKVYKRLLSGEYVEINTKILRHMAIEEMADVWTCLTELVKLLNCSAELSEVIEIKAERTIERMGKE